jgi:hypothetical protein
LRRCVVALAIGLFGGFALGVVSRAWMRLISEDPDFTWNGTSLGTGTLRLRAGRGGRG